MNKDFVSYELAKELVYKGFNAPCIAYYDEGVLLYNTKYPFALTAEELLISHNSRNTWVDAPTIFQVLKWLREDKVISVEPYASASGWRVTICRAYHQDRCDTGGGTCLKREVIGYNDGGAFEKYEEAALAGIEYVIDNLI